MRHVRARVSICCTSLLILGLIFCSTAALSAPPLPPTKLAFTVQPVNGTAGATLPAVQVSSEDATGKVVTTDNTTQVQLTLSTNTLNGTLTQTVVKGVATFSNLSINTAATGYTLSAAAANLPPLTGATSNPFDIVPAAPAKLLFGQEPTNVAAGEYIVPAVTVRVEDAFSNLATNDSSTQVTVSIGLCGGPIPLEIVADNAGIATFGALRLNSMATGVILDASATGLTGASSTKFDVTANTDRLFFNGFDDPACTP
jgi:hypothetical protein